MPRRSVPLELTVEQMSKLCRWLRAGSTPQQVALRARIAQGAASGESDKQIAGTLCVHPRTVALWRRRVRDEGIGCVWEVAAGRGRKPTFGATTIEEFLATWTDDPLPYAWTASVEKILSKVERCRQRLELIKPGCTKPPRSARSLAFR